MNTLMRISLIARHPLLANEEENCSAFAKMMANRPMRLMSIELVYRYFFFYGMDKVTGKTLDKRDEKKIFAKNTQKKKRLYLLT